MKPPAWRRVQQAQQDGRWEAAYEAQSVIAVPDDLQQALDQHPQAAASSPR